MYGSGLYGGVDSGAAPSGGTIAPTGIPSGEAVGTPTISGAPGTIAPSGISSSATVGAPTVSGAVANISPTGIPSATAVGTPTISGGSGVISPTGISSSAVVGIPIIGRTAFDNAIGPLGITSNAAVGTPSLGGPHAVTSPSVLVLGAPKYQFILCNSPNFVNPYGELERLGELSEARSRQFQIVRNRAGSATFSLKTSDPMMAQALDLVDFGDIRGTIRKSLLIRRNKKDIWSGPIWGIQGSLADGALTFSCVGWLERLQHRILWQTADYSNQGNGTPSDEIAFGLLDLINGQDLAHPLYIKRGTVTGVMPLRNRFYVRGQNFGQALQELSDIESGYDYEVDPTTRALNLYAWDSYAIRKDIHLGYRRGPDNLRDVQWQEDGSRTCNYMAIQSQGAPVTVEDSTSIDVYGRFEENNTITGANQSILAPYGMAEMAIRSRPFITYSLIPYPSKSPRLFDDFQFGEMIYFSAKKEYITIPRQAVRIFGADVSLDDNGNETINQLMTTPSS